MRDGTLLAEESPNQLLLKHNCSTLEQAFLELSKRQTRSSIMDREDENCVCPNLLCLLIFEGFILSISYLPLYWLKILKNGFVI